MGVRVPLRARTRQPTWLPFSFCGLVLAATRIERLQGARAWITFADPAAKGAGTGAHRRASLGRGKEALCGDAHPAKRSVASIGFTQRASGSGTQAIARCHRSTSSRSCHCPYAGFMRGLVRAAAVRDGPTPFGRPQIFVRIIVFARSRSRLAPTNSRSMSPSIGTAAASQCSRSTRPLPSRSTRPRRRDRSIRRWTPVGTVRRNQVPSAGRMHYPAVRA